MKAKKKKRTISSLPNELLCRIFSNLSTNDLISNVATVSRRFHGLTHVPEIHDSVALKDAHDDKASNFLAINNLVKDLHLTTKDLLLFKDSVQLSNAVFSQRRLKNLNICQKIVVDEQSIRSLLNNSNSKFLEKLVITRCLSENEEQISDDWTCCSVNLKHLELGFKGSSTLDKSNFNARTIVEILHTSRELKFLKFTGTFSNDQSLGPTLKKHRKTLRTILLPNVGTSEEDVKVIAQCQKLEILDLKLGDISAKTLVSIPDNKKLKTLSLDLESAKKVSAMDVANLLRHSNLSTNLTHLTLMLDKIRAFSPEILMALGSCQNLNYLRVLQDEDFEETYGKVLKVLDKCKKLETLIIRIYIEFRLKGLKKLFNQKFSNLKYLKMECWDDVNYDGRIWNFLKEIDSFKAVYLGNSIYYRSDEETLARYDTTKCFYSPVEEEKMAPKVFEELEGIHSFLEIPLPSSSEDS